MDDNDTELVVAHTSSGAEEPAKKIPKARVVLAFNIVPVRCFLAFTRPAQGQSTKPSLLWDDRSAKELAAGLISDVGFDPVDAGPLQIADTSSHLRCLSDSSYTREKKARNWPTVSSGLEDRIIKISLNRCLSGHFHYLNFDDG